MVFKYLKGYKNILSVFGIVISSSMSGPQHLKGLSVYQIELNFVPCPEKSIYKISIKLLAKCSALPRTLKANIAVL